ncbi:MAG TPA: helix-turn-helix domain-containing protein [Myxococcales bacterium]|jgi:AcrR family transcriptional regulator
MVPATDQARERRNGRAREDILDAAARAIARSGYAQTTMGDIAEEAGYTVPSLYAYYSGKDQIVEALAATLSSEILAVFDEGFPDGLTTGQRVELLLRRLFTMTDRRRDVLRVFLALPMKGRMSGGEIPDGYEVFRMRLARWFRENERLGPRGRKTADDLSVTLLSLCEGFLQRWLRLGARTLLVQQAPLVTDLFLHGALQAIQGRRAAR